MSVVCSSGSLGLVTGEAFENRDAEVAENGLLFRLIVDVVEVDEGKVFLEDVDAVGRAGVLVSTLLGVHNWCSCIGSGFKAWLFIWRRLIIHYTPSSCAESLLLAKV